MRVVVAQDKMGDRESIRRLLLGMGLECGNNDCVAHEELLVRLAQNPTDLLLVRVGSDESATLSFIRQAIPLTKAPVMVFGPAADAQQILRYLQGGAREFLDEAELQGNLENALEKIRLSGELRSGTGIVVGVISPTPGAGVSTVAINLAFAWAYRHPNQVALLEFGRGAADLALSLDLQPRHTITEVHQSWERLDATALKQSMLAHPGGVHVLPHKPEALSPDLIPPQAVRKSVILLRTIYDASFLDLGHTVGEEQTEALRLCDVIVVVVRLDVPALRQTRRFLRLLSDRGVPKDRLKPIANRYGQRSQISWKKAEEAIGMSLAGHVSEDVGKVNAAVNQGQPVVKVATTMWGISRCFYKLVEQLNGRPA